MYRKTILAGALVAAALIGNAGAADLPSKAIKPVVDPPLFFVNDNSISYHYEFTANNPGAGTTPKNVLTFTHFDVWAYGTNFFNVDWLKATNAKAPPNGAPAAPCDFNGTNVCAGFTEIYMFFRSTFGLNQLTNSKKFAWGPLTNVEIVVGADLNTDNTTLGSAKRSIQGGLQFDFMAPYKGFFNVSFGAYHEWQNDGFSALGGGNPSGKVEFNTTWVVEYLYIQPLGFMPASIPLTVEAFGTIHGPKGKGEPGTAGLNRTTEYRLEQHLSLDVGKMITGTGHRFSVWGGYRWWKNKFGIDPVQPGFSFSQTIESTWLLGTTLTF